MGASVQTVPAPVGGLNAYDSLAGMPETDAVALINLFPQEYGLYLRRGFDRWSTGLGAPVRSLATMPLRAGPVRLYGWAGTNFYNCTTQGGVGAPIFTGLADSVWQWTSFSNTAGSHLIAFNGTDDGIWITESANNRLIAGDGVASGTWKDVDPKTLIDVTVHQRRVWVVQKNTTYGWYLPPDQVYGDATLFDFGPLFKHGGYLQSLATWTVDDGDGADDMLVAISSEGDVAVYKGIDPSNAATWSLQGVYFMGRPVSGRRFHNKVAGDIKFITQQGLVSLNDMLTSTKVNAAQSSIEAQKVQQPLAAAATELGSLFGWEIKFIPALNMLLINIPSVTAEPSIQFVENVVNSKWCEFNGYDANTFVDYNNLPFFGSDDGNIYRGWTGFADNVNAGSPEGNFIYGFCQAAYSYLGTPAVQKQVGMYRPNFLLSSDVAYGAAIAYDFTFQTPTADGTPAAAGGARWDSAIWDEAIWSGALKSKNDWSSAVGVGFAASLCMAVKARDEVVWVSTDFTFITGRGVF